MKNSMFPGIPGVVVVENNSSDDFFSSVEGTISVGEKSFRVAFTRSKKVPTFVAFTLRQIEIPAEKKIVWRFRDEGWEGFCRLFAFRGQIVIGYLKKNKNGVLARVLPLEDLEKPIMDINGYKVPYGKTIVEMAQLKRRLALSEGFLYEHSETEKEALAEAAKKSVLAKAKSLEEKRTRNAQIVREILARPRVYAFNGAGDGFSGTPVVGNEWEKLSKGFVVLVESYDQETAAVGQPLEAFYVNQRGNTKTKGGVKTGLSWDKPSRQVVSVGKVPVIKITKMVDVVLDGETVQLGVIPKKEIKTYKGLVDDDARFAVPVKDKEGVYQVIAYRGNEVKTLGNVKEA